MKYYFDHYPIADLLEPCHALYGGRTNASKLYHRCEGDEQIKYVDFTSLYPHVNRSKTVPTGHPEIITENYEEDVSNYFGLIKCTMFPPRFVSSRITVLYSRQIDVRVMQNLCRYL